MTHGSSFPLVDRILGHTLRSELAARRQRGDSYETIARWLDADHDIVVTGQTIRSWCAAHVPSAKRPAK